MITIINIANSLATIYDLKITRCDIQRVTRENNYYYVGFLYLKDTEGKESFFRVLDDGTIEEI